MKYNLHRLGETNKPRRGKDMIRQRVLPFKLERTEEKVTARSGLVLYAEFMKGMKLEELVDRHMPRAGSGRGFKGISYIESRLTDNKDQRSRFICRPAIIFGRSIAKPKQIK